MIQYFPNYEYDEVPISGTEQIEEVHINNPSYVYDVSQGNNLLNNEFQLPNLQYSSQCDAGDINFQFERIGTSQYQLRK